MISIMIVDDQDILRDGLALLLGNEEDIEVVCTASNGEEGVNRCKNHSIDVVLMDINMPVMNGVEATRLIKECHKDIKVLILTTFNDDEYIFNSLKYGASGYILKDSSPKEIASAIRTVQSGQAFFQANVATKVVEQFLELAEGKKKDKPDSRIESLTEREKGICKLLSEGKNNKEIAEVLFITEGTVKNHITNILVKLDLRDRTQLAIFAVRNINAF